MPQQSFRSSFCLIDKNYTHRFIAQIYTNFSNKNYFDKFFSKFSIIL